MKFKKKLGVALSVMVVLFVAFINSKSFIKYSLIKPHKKITTSSDLESGLSPSNTGLVAIENDFNLESGSDTDWAEWDYEDGSDEEFDLN